MTVTITDPHGSASITELDDITADDVADACFRAMLARGYTPDSVCDAFLKAAGERQPYHFRPGGVAGHQE
jgi:hypothetical protein